MSITKEDIEGQLKRLEGEEITKMQGTSFIDHKCSFCKQKIPAGSGLIRVTKIIRTPYSENPIYSSKYYCDENCKNRTSKVKDESPIPEGFEIVS